VIKRLHGFNLKIIKSIHDFILALVEVLNLILLGLSDSLFETLPQLVEVAVDCFEVRIELVYQLLCIISDYRTDSVFDLLSHFLKENLDMRTLRLVDEKILDLDDGFKHF